MFLRCDRICLFGSSKLGMWSGELFVCHIQVDKFNFVVVVVVVLSSSFLLLKSSCSVQGTTSAAHLTETLCHYEWLCRSQVVLWNHDATWRKLLPMGKKKKRKGEKKPTLQHPSSSKTAESLPVCLGAVSFSLLLKLRRSFMVMPKNLKTDWSFVGCVKQQLRTKIPAFPAKCEVTFFRNTTLWNCQSLKNCSCLIAQSILGAGTQHEAPTQSASPFTLINHSPSLFVWSAGTNRAALNDTAISLASFAPASAAMETYWY